MKVRTQLFLDRTVIRFLIFFLNVIVKILGKILRIDHNLDRPFKVIAVCKFKGMGSIIQATPLLQTLRKNYPDAKIIFVTTKGNVSILKILPFVDEVVSLDDSGFIPLLKNVIPFVFKLLRLNIDLYLDLEIYSNFSSLITTLSAAKNRVGFYLRSSNYRFGIYTHMMYFNTRVPIHKTYLQLSRLLNCKEIVPALFELPSELSRLTIGKTDYDLQKLKYIVINPNASDLRLERRWEMDKYIELIEKILNKYSDHIVFLIGSGAEFEYVNTLHLKIAPNPLLINLAGKTSVNELISVIKYASLMITNDTGPMHIAFCLKTPTIALFGPCSPDQYGNLQNCKTIYHKVYCSPCVHEFEMPPCKGNNHCMKSIEVNEVFASMETMVPFFDHSCSSDSDTTIYISQGEQGKTDVLGYLNRF